MRALHALAILTVMVIACLPITIQARAQAPLPPEYNPLIYERLDLTVRVLDNGSAVISIRSVMRNQGKVIVVPGYGNIPLTVAGSEVRVLDARDLKTGKKMEALVVRDNESRTIRYALWQPLKPGETEEFEITFSVSEVLARGLVFDEFEMTLGPLSNYVKEGSVRVIPPPGRAVTFVDPPVDGTTWSLSGLRPDERVRISVEFSLLPLPRLPVKGYVVFWGGMAVLIILLAVIRVRRDGGRGKG